MSKRHKAKEGASMVIALILLIVFLVIGTSVLTAASASVSSAAALREEKQLYYFARSVAVSFTDGMTKQWGGALWDNINKIIENEPDREEYTCTLSVNNSLPDGFMKEGNRELNMDPVTIRLEGVRLNEDGSLRAVGKMTAEFVVRYGGGARAYRMMAEYTYQKPEDDEHAESGWTLVKYDQP
ncbi:PilX N-terminal domain-containing pilus assembly protein [Christensenella intestinihominis]|uniref:PilX N-terminal domain-containing pilus assembly protein n=1 Tax=Christensenella intestinihominis TaxID=1851429 RepID=UPI000830F08D|nr:PilX N-terminal domain-containing pilus assembly protein [Christensenella intestinihominis]